MADDATRWEGSVLDPDAARHEGSVLDPDATRHEGSVLDPDATRHEGVAAPGSRRGLPRLGHLPTALEERYEFIETLSTSGGQADILLCRSRGSGQLAVVKLYRGHPVIDRVTFDKVRRVDAAHVTPILELYTGPDGTWEVQEYFGHGSLHDLMRERGEGPQDPQFVKVVLRELTDALQALHAEGVSHRDLKPGNVFVRSVGPTLDLVLGDFGFARDLSMSGEYMSVVGVFHYTAPEVALSGLASPAGDWWALGVIVFELLTGHSLFVDDTGRRQANQHQVRGALHQGAFSVAEVTDPRWNLLLRGLLNHARQHRWSDAQVNAWLAGGSPEVVEVPVAPDHVTPRPVPPFSLPWGRFEEPRALVASLTARWSDACEYLQGQESTHLRIWLERTTLGDAASATLRSVRERELSASAGLVHLQMLVNPGSPVSFRGRTIDATTVADAARRAAAGDVPAQEWIRALRSEQVLSAVANQSDDGPRFASANLALRQHWRRLGDLLDQAAKNSALRDLVPTIRGPLEGVVLATSLDESQAGAHVARAREVAARLKPSDPQELRSAVPRLEAGSVPDALVLEFLGPDAIAARENRERAAAEERDRAQQQALIERQRREREQAAQRTRQRVRQAARRVRNRLIAAAAAVAILTASTVSTLDMASWEPVAIAYGVPMLAGIGVAFLVECLVPTRPPRLAFAWGFVTVFWGGLTSFPGVTAPLLPGVVIGWFTGLVWWFIPGYVVGYLAGFVLERLRGPLSRSVPAAATWPLVAVVPAVATQLVVATLGLPARDLGAGQLGLDVARALTFPFAGLVPADALHTIALASAVGAILALTSGEQLRRLPRPLYVGLWTVLVAASVWVVIAFAPVLAIGFWVLVAVAVCLGVLSVVVVASQS